MIEGFDRGDGKLDAPIKHKKIVIVGSGLSAIAFYYAFARNRSSPCKVIVVAGEERGMECSLPVFHGYRNATNYLGLGGTTEIWGGVLKPYPRDMNALQTQQVADIRTACLSMGVCYALPIWKSEQVFSSKSDNFIEKSYFAIARNLSSFWSDIAPHMLNDAEFTLVRNTNCKRISKGADGCWEVQLSGPNEGTSISGVDNVFIASGVFKTIGVLRDSSLVSLYSPMDGVDHKMGVIGRLDCLKPIDIKKILPGNHTGRFAFAGMFKGHSFTIYLYPALRYKITTSRGQDRVVAISAIKRPFEFLRNFGSVRYFGPRNIANIIEVLRSFIFGTRSFDVVYVSEQKRCSNGVREISGDFELLSDFQLFISAQLREFGEYHPFSENEVNEELRSAIHKTSTLVNPTRNGNFDWGLPVIIDASALQATSSFNPSLEVAIMASRIAREFAETLKQNPDEEENDEKYVNSRC